MHQRTYISPPNRHVSEGGEHIQRRDQCRVVGDGVQELSDLFTELGEQCRFHLEQSILSAQDFLLITLQLLGDVALRIHQGLFPNPLFRDLVLMGVGHLEIISEHFVEADLQRGNAGTKGFGLLQFRKPLLSAVRQLPELIQLL